MTKQVLLEKELASTKEAQEVAMLDMLKSILHIDADKLLYSFALADNILKEINKTLEVKKKGFSDAEIRSTLQKISTKCIALKVIQLL